MNGAFSDAVDIPTRFCFAVNKASKRKCACPPLFDCAVFSRQIRNREAGLGAVYLPPLTENEQFFSNSYSQKSRPFSYRDKRGA